MCGRPNVGKSTLVNHLVGEKIAIVTDIPGTTRSAIRGVVTRDDAQLILLDTPGLAKPRTLLTRRLNDLVRDTWAGVDAVLFLVDAAAGIGRGDAFLAAELRAVNTPVIAVANKIDELRDTSALLPILARLAELRGPDAPFTEVVPVSAASGDNVDRLLQLTINQLPHAGRLFPGGQVTDQPERVRAAEILREKLLDGARDELPHSIAVTVDEVRDDTNRADLVHIDAVIHVERDSLKGIVIGQGGQRLKAAAPSARHDLDVRFGRK
ncbi:MAG: GTPase Era, partial [Nitriliruptoraceae bacterium]